MNNAFQDFLGALSGYKQKYDAVYPTLEACHRVRDALSKELDKTKETIRQLELLTSVSTPPALDYIAEQSTLQIDKYLLKLGAPVVRLTLDNNYRMTNQKNFLNVIAWDWIDRISYEREIFDCENFAIAFKAHVDLYFHLNQVGIVIDYDAGHGYNLVVFPTGNIMLLEPQSDQLFVWTERSAQYILNKAFVLL